MRLVAPLRCGLGEETTHLDLGNNAPFGVLSSPSTLIHFSRAPIPLRGICLAVALSVATAGSGLPMCISVLSQASAPCDMHGHSRTATHDHGAQPAALEAQTTGQACHQDAAGLGCAAGSTCLSGGPATPAWAKVPIANRAASRQGVLGPASAFVSYCAPPQGPNDEVVGGTRNQQGAFRFRATKVGADTALARIVATGVPPQGD